MHAIPESEGQTAVDDSTKNHGCAAAPVRHSEKERASSCAFAEAVASAVLEAFRDTAPAHFRDSLAHTVVAGLVVSLDRDHDVEGVTSSSTTAAGSSQVAPPRLWVLAVAAGTKYCAADVVAEDRRAARAAGGGCQLVHDMHAECLARRGLQAALVRQLQGAVLLSSEEHLSASADVDHDDAFRSAIERVLPCGSRLHLYTSSAPCGDACVKEWGKGEKPVPLDPATFGPRVPTNADLPQLAKYGGTHPRIDLVAARQGQGAVLHKKPWFTVTSSPSPAAVSPRGDDVEPPPADHVQSSVKHHRCESGGADVPMVYKHIPPSCCAPPPLSANDYDDWGREGALPSCSDRIAKWHALGLEGALLRPFFLRFFIKRHPSAVRSGDDEEVDDPRLLPHAVIVGRKYSGTHLRRALCCRLQGLGSREERPNRRRRRHGAVDEPVGESGSRPDPAVRTYAVQHPVVLCAATKLDTSVREQDEAASFTDPRCFVAFRTLPGAPWTAEVLVDGRQEDGSRSGLCTAALFDALRPLIPLLRLRCRARDGDDEKSASHQPTDGLTYRQWKALTEDGLDPLAETHTATRRRLFGTPLKFLHHYK